MTGMAAEEGHPAVRGYLLALQRYQQENHEMRYCTCWFLLAKLLSLSASNAHQGRNVFVMSLHSCSAIFGRVSAAAWPPVSWSSVAILDYKEYLTGQETSTCLMSGTNVTCERRWPLLHFGRHVCQQGSHIDAARAFKK